MSLTQLNLEQETAATHVEGPMLVLAGAGSGKTRVVVHRIAHLIDLGILPSDILAVTFTNKAAEEMRNRIRSMKNAQVLSCTFHSLGARILRESISALNYRSDFVIYDEDDSEKLLKGCLEELELNGKQGLLREIRSQISRAKNDLQPPESISDTQEPLFKKAYALYQSKLKECNALDFDDLLYLTVTLLQSDEKVRLEYQNRWLFVLIDEYQDTNMAQYLLAKLLVAKHQNLFVVGDPDQSIYSWRGARYQNILNFERDFPGGKVVRLEQNYRSTPTILEASNALIAHNQNRFKKNLWSNREAGEKIGLFIAPTEREEANFVADQILLHGAIPRNEIAIFYRTNAQSRAFEDALLSRKISYTIVGGLSFYARKEIKDILSFLRLILSNSDLISFQRTVNIPKRGLGAATLEKLMQAASSQGIPILTFCEGHLAEIKLSAKQKTAFSDYLSLIRSLRNQAKTKKIHELIDSLIKESHYLDFLLEDPETAEDRKENINELIGKALEWEQEHPNPSLQQFLEELSLRSSTEEESFVPSVQLMTLHNSKGLEFPLVFLAGLEENLCPHVNCQNSEEQIEEERRLCYVGMTRAKEMLYLTATSARFMWGSLQRMELSRFLREIPTRFIRNFGRESSSSSEEFSIGDRVFHQQFGRGIIEGVSQGSLGLVYEVRFPDSEATRSLVARYAKLRSYK